MNKPGNIGQLTETEERCSMLDVCSRYLVRIADRPLVLATMLVTQMGCQSLVIALSSSEGSEEGSTTGGGMGGSPGASSGGASSGGVSSGGVSSGGAGAMGGSGGGSSSGGNGGQGGMGNGGTSGGEVIAGVTFGSAGDEDVTGLVRDAKTGLFVLTGGTNGSGSLGELACNAVGNGKQNVYVSWIDASTVPKPQCPQSKLYLSGTSATILDIAAFPASVSGGVALAGQYAGAMSFDGFTLPGNDANAVVARMNEVSCEWARPLGNQGEQKGRAVAVNSLGEVWSGGSFTGTISVNGMLILAALEDGFLAKFDQKGTPLFFKQIGGAGNQDVRALATTADGVVVAGYFEQIIDLGCGSLTASGDGRVFLAKLQNDGTCAWQKLLVTGATDAAKKTTVRLISTGSGDIVVAGAFESTELFPGDPTCTRPAANNQLDAFLAKLGPNGDCIWAERLAEVASYPSAVQQIRAITVDSSGNIYAAGDFAWSIGFGSHQLVSQNNNNHPFFVKFDSSGKSIWTRSIGIAQSANQYGKAIALAADESFVLVAGTFSGTMTLADQSVDSKGLADIFLAKLEP